MNNDGMQRALEGAIEGEVRFDALSRALYSTDASVYQIVPAGVVIPRSRADIVNTVRIVREYGGSITARGGGTSQAGQAIGAGVQLDTSKYFNRILELNPEERWVVVEPGIVLDDLNAAVRPHRLRFAPDISTASRATVGGMIANNSSGARSVVYGKTIDHVLALEVVFADGSSAAIGSLDEAQYNAVASGSTAEARVCRAVRDIASRYAVEVERRFPRVLRRVGGYNLDEFIDRSKPFNLTKMIVGSEGTLALVTAAKLALVPLPGAKAVVAIEFDELLDALAATPRILRHQPSAVEVMDRFILDHARESPALDALRRSIMQGEAGALLCVEFYADRPQDLLPRLSALEEDLAGSGLRSRWRRFEDEADQARVWSFREAALGLSMAMKGDEKSLSFVEDTAVAPERLRDYIERFLQIVAAHGTRAGVYAHASVGCLHVRPVIDLKTRDGIRRFEAIANAVADLVLEFGGALSGEHGDGLVRGPFIEKMFGPSLYRAFREVKDAFDPGRLFNPGKIVDTPPLTANLRYGADYVTPEPAAFFDYRDHGGFGRAVEMCSGLGACRKTASGTMCPSYMATLEEKHSTRGRANALRLAMVGRLGDSSLSEQDVFEVLDLCLECRACKAECPVGVDVGRFKSEFLAGYWKEHGTPASVRAIGQIRMLLESGSRFPGIANAVARSTPFRWLADAMFGIDRRRPLPRLAAQTFAEKAAKDRTGSGSPGGAAVIVFNDTFTNYCHPQIGSAAVAVLRAAGCAPQVVGHGCCGRPLISKGLLDDAKRLAEANVTALYADAARGTPIVFLEPSCLSAIREDGPDLLRGDAQRRAKVVAGASILFEDLVERRIQAKETPLAFAAGPRTVLLHGHCHQKAMGMMPAARALLARIPQATVTDLDAGCCGMAGSFGYAREHYDVSQLIGERRLLPAARAMDRDAVLVASGTSCREQVAHFAGVRALHSAELLEPLIRTAP